MIDPISDGYEYSWDPYAISPKARMYNESCSIYKQYQLEYKDYMRKWKRKCPEGVTNCFWSKGIKQRKKEEEKNEVGM